jgi:hypothetical protein
MAPGSLLRNKAARPEVDPSTPCGVKVKNEWSYTSAVGNVFMA